MKRKERVKKRKSPLEGRLSALVGARNAFRNPARAVLVVLVLGLSVGIFVTMLRGNATTALQARRPPESADGYRHMQPRRSRKVTAGNPEGWSRPRVSRGDAFRRLLCATVAPACLLAMAGEVSADPFKVGLSQLDGTNGFALNGINNIDGTGISVSGAGDVNGDGIDDIIIGARGASKSYVGFVRANGLEAAWGVP